MMISKNDVVEKKDANLITKKDIMKMFWRSLSIQFSWHYERQMHMGFEFMMIPFSRLQRYKYFRKVDIFPSNIYIFL